MSPAEVKRKVLDAIGNDWSRSNLHGVDLRKCLLSLPIRKTFRNSWFDPRVRESDANRLNQERWLILEERPVEKDGYAIVYEEGTDQFGLASGETLIAFYGSFIETLNAM
jgi:hypothetical protein